MDRYQKLSAWLLAAACVLMLLLMAAACLDIYFDGECFSRESIALRFSAIAPILGICLLLGLAAIPAAAKNRGPAGSSSGRAMCRRGKEEKHSTLITVILLALAGLFILLGAINGGARDVFVKAINICTECIGLG